MTATQAPLVVDDSLTDGRAGFGAVPLDNP